MRKAARLQSGTETWTVVAQGLCTMLHSWRLLPPTDYLLMDGNMAHSIRLAEASKDFIADPVLCYHAATPTTLR